MVASSALYWFSFCWTAWANSSIFSLSLRWWSTWTELVRLQANDLPAIANRRVFAQSSTQSSDLLRNHIEMCSSLRNFCWIVGDEKSVRWVQSKCLKGANVTPDCLPVTPSSPVVRRGETPRSVLSKCECTWHISIELNAWIIPNCKLNERDQSRGRSFPGQIVSHPSECDVRLVLTFDLHARIRYWHDLSSMHSSVKSIKADDFWCTSVERLPRC